MENDEMTNDAAVAWYYEFGDTGEAGPVTFGGDPGREAIEWAERYGHTLHYLVPATTVAELRARVAELEAGARELRTAFIFRQAVVASAETPEKIDFADDKVWAAAEKVRELLGKSP